MKNLSIMLVLLLFSAYSFSQEYTFKKISTDNYSFDMIGKITVKDTLITIESETHKASSYPVKTAIKNDTLSKYKSNLKSLEAIFTLNNKQKTFVYEFKDITTEKSTKMIYILD